MDSKAAAIKWFERQANAVHDGTFTAPVPSPVDSEGRAPKFADYSGDWLTHREKLAATNAPRLPRHDRHLPSAAVRPHRLDKITAGDVRAHGIETCSQTRLTCARRSTARSRQSCGRRGARELIEATPCRVEGASSVKRKDQDRGTDPGTGARACRRDGITGERTLAAASTARRVLVFAWCGWLREATELWAQDVVVGDDGSASSHPSAPSGNAGRSRLCRRSAEVRGRVRDATVPPHIRADLADHSGQPPRPSRGAPVPRQSQRCLPSSQQPLQAVPTEREEVYQRCGGMTRGIRRHDGGSDRCTTIEVQASLGH